ncbi:MAG: alcohol dehydrogenase catalytic domain-containing protein [Anaerolineae bacterium]|nr:alcohol dehydrogenase catalytic domain-containing protein [Anaerolineae bacterium]
MRAVIFDGTLRVVSDAPEPVLQSDAEVVIQPRLMGICNTDLELTRGYKDFSGILGHEFVGKVVAGDPAWIGRRVVGEISLACGECDFCRRNVPSQCRNRTTLGIWQHPGVFADYASLPTANLKAVDDRISDRAAVFVEPLAACLQITEAVHISPRDRVVVIGAGKMGLLAAQVLKLTGADVRVIVRRERPARLLSGWRIPAVERAAVADKSIDIVVDCTGNESGFAEALQMVRARGTIVLKSTYAHLPTADLTRVVVDEITVVGSRCGPFEAALRLLAHGLIDVESMIDAEYSLDEVLAAFDSAAQPGALKVLLTPASEWPVT